MQNDPKAMQEAMKLAQSEAGRQLMKMLQNTDSAAVQQAMSGAAAGNYDAVKKALAPMLRNPEILALLNQMGGNHGSDGR